jgi:hypothetical protein
MPTRRIVLMAGLPMPDSGKTNQIASIAGECKKHDGLLNRLFRVASNSP